MAYLDVNNTIKSVKRHLIERMNIFVNLVDDKVLLSISVTKMETTQLKKWAKDSNRHFSFDEVQMAINT